MRISEATLIISERPGRHILRGCVGFKNEKFVVWLYLKFVVDELLHIERIFILEVRQVLIILVLRDVILVGQE